MSWTPTGSYRKWRSTGSPFELKQLVIQTKPFSPCYETYTKYNMGMPSFTSNFFVLRSKKKKQGKKRIQHILPFVDFVVTDHRLATEHRQQGDSWGLVAKAKPLAKSWATLSPTCAAWHPKPTVSSPHTTRAGGTRSPTQVVIGSSLYVRMRLSRGKEIRQREEGEKERK